MRNFRFIYILFIALFVQSALLNGQKVLEQKISDSLTFIARRTIWSEKINRINIDVNKTDKILTVTAGENFGHIPFRIDNVDRIYAAMYSILSKTYPEFKIRVMAYDRLIEELIPNHLREIPDSARLFHKNRIAVPLITKISSPMKITKGLNNRNIALWNSHGLYYHQSFKKWLWQRPVLFQTCEDLLTTAFVLPYVAPMLENAGALTFIPRERDIQINEVIVDNDEANSSRYKEYNHRYSWKPIEKGFSNGKPWYNFGENPFEAGTSRQVKTVTDPDETSRVEWVPDIPARGKYAVYISYKSTENSCENAHYTVFHAGGTTDFIVNQTMYGSTWLYLGHFLFDKGKNPEGKVVLNNLCSDTGKLITADAVKFGGGMGNMARFPTNAKDSISMIPITSKYPRFMEGARYWLQWSGAPDSVYSRTANTNDYSDDFQSRGFWTNYISGGSEVNPNVKGLGIPIDLAFAFHTDAGIMKNDSTVGTLGICTVLNTKGESTYKNGVSRWAARDMNDLIQTQIVNDIRKGHLKTWTRRGIWNRSYSESRNPEVPTMLLELLSHQNFEDMKFALDPNFRFTVSRAIYKGILKYLALTNDIEYVVQPLPVKEFSCQFTARNKILLQWEATTDTLEPTAKADKFIVYTRIDDGGFDNGKLVTKNSWELNISSGKTYSFKVTAVNDGGESFPSEILSAYRDWKSKEVVLVVNGFNRLSGPERVNNGKNKGFVNVRDAGVPYLYDISFTGAQTEFSTESKYIDNEQAGFGLSKTDYESTIIAGNTFDYPYLHGKSILAAGFSYTSAGADAVTSGKIDLIDYKVVDLILGKQKQTPLGNVKSPSAYKTFPAELQHKLREFCEQGGNLMVSGAYVASDMTYNKEKKDAIFIEELLKIRLRKDEYKPKGGVIIKSTDPKFFIGNDKFEYRTRPDTQMYFVEKPDCLMPVGTKAFRICSLAGNLPEAAVGIAYAGSYKTCTFSIPFETIKDEESRNKLMKSVLTFFFQKK